jgi:hypothetical protein
MWRKINSSLGFARDSDTFFRFIGANLLRECNGIFLKAGKCELPVAWRSKRLDTSTPPALGTDRSLIVPQPQADGPVAQK